MNRRDMLLTAGAAAVGLSAFPLDLIAADREETAQGALLHPQRRLRASAGHSQRTTNSANRRSC